jgi:hypothetical protein
MYYPAMPHYPQYQPQQVFFAPAPMPQTPVLAPSFELQITQQMSHESIQAPPTAATQTSNGSEQYVESQTNA